MLIRFGFDLAYELPAPTPVLLLLQLRPELAQRLRSAEEIVLRPDVNREEFLDSFGNRCLRLLAPAGGLELSCRAVIEDSGEPAPIVADARQHPVSELPPEVLRFLQPSRYCELELLGPLAWPQFGGAPPGWPCVQNICDWVHGHLRFDYALARSTRTAFEAMREGVGVCRDFTHLAIAFCRCLNIPARYVAGYLGDFGVPPDDSPMDFSAWMEVYLGEAWHVFDVRHNARRIGHLPMAWGQDASDVAITTSFGPHTLRRFSVTTEEAAETFSTGLTSEEIRRGHDGICGPRC
jgi:transglutaminase-like putative cysteine protease